MQETWVQSLGERLPGGGNANPLQYSCQENPMDRGAWQATVHAVSRWAKTERLNMHAFILSKQWKLYKINITYSN